MNLKFKTTMKKIFLTLATVGILATSAFAKIDGGKKAETVTVSFSVQAEFDEQFGNAANVVWAITPNCQKATFVQDNVKKTAFYNLQGEYLGVTQDVDYNSLAVKAQKTIAAKYAGYNVGEVIKLQTNDSSSNFDQTVYFVDLKKDNAEILVRVTSSSDVYYFQTVK